MKNINFNLNKNFAVYYIFSFDINFYIKIHHKIVIIKYNHKIIKTKIKKKKTKINIIKNVLNVKK